MGPPGCCKYSDLINEYQEIKKIIVVIVWRYPGLVKRIMFTFVSSSTLYIYFRVWSQKWASLGSILFDMYPIYN